MYGVQDPKTKSISKSRVEHFTQIAQLNMSQKEIDTPDGYILMAGFRDYSLDKYLKVATQNGYTAVVYTQNMTNPKAITREFYGVYSPGTFISFDTDTSQQLSNNTICIWLSTYTPIHTRTPQLICGISSAHIFTGESAIFEYETPFLMNPTTFDELERYVSVASPSEAIIISYLSDNETNQVIQYSGLRTSMIHIIHVETETNLDKRAIVDKCQKEVFVSHILSKFFGTDAYEVCNEFQMYPTGTYSLTYLLHFLQERNPDLVKKITPPLFFNSAHRVALANHTLKQLNIIDDHSTDSKRAGRFSSVASFLNRCCSPMGRRVLHRQITNPTTDPEWLNRQYQLISHFMTIPQETFDTVRSQLRQIRDLEKICRQMVAQKIWPNTII
jgi:DNA mismatch repair ATPase MutS